MLRDKSFEQRIQQIEGLIAKVENLNDPDARASARELIELLMELHGAGLMRILEILHESGHAQQLAERLGRDELVGPLLLLYGIHPVDIETRVNRALEKVRPYLRSHGGNVELIAISETNDIQLRLQGSCNGCPSSAMTMKLAIEEALYEAAPDINSIQVEGVIEQKPPRNFVPIAKSKEPSDTAGWKELSGLDSLHQGSVRTVDVEGHAVLICRIAESYYAYSSECPHCGKGLAAEVAGVSALICAECGQKYDAVRAGRGLDQPALHLQPFPLLMEHGRVRIALPAG